MIRYKYSHARSLALAIGAAAAILLGQFNATAETLIVNPAGQTVVVTEPAPKAGAESAPAATAGVTRTGNLSLKLVVQLSSTIPQNNPVTCDMTPTVIGNDTTYGLVDFIVERAQIVATKSGSTATCTFVLPYRWTLFAATDYIKFGYTVSATDSGGQVRSVQTGGAISFSNTVGGTPVPTTNGATTPLTAYARL